VDLDADFADRLEIFFGHASDALARVYARLRGPEATEGLKLFGTLAGPDCLYAQTLPATFSFVDLGEGNSLVAQAVVPEPCFWSPQMPHQYRADVRLQRGGETVARAQRQLGIRLLGAAGRNLIHDGKRWVLRAVRGDEVATLDLHEWHEAEAALMVQNPPDELCREASRIGVLVVAELVTADPGEIRRLSRWPAVGLVVLDRAAEVDLQGLAHNLLLAERFAADDPLRPAPWANVAICEVARPEEMAAKAADCGLPILALRPGGPFAGVEPGRAQCDRLQRDLAGYGQFAGFIV
jgi:hypothetical protein